MANFVWSAIIFSVISFSEGYQTYDYGDGIIHKLNIVQDVALERNANFDYLQFLIVARHIGYPLKRSLVQFENLRSSCPPNKIQYAKMYLYFAYAHKASFMSIKLAPYLKHTFQLYRVLKPWKEREATNVYRQRGLKWNSTLLNIGNDTESEPQCEYSFNERSQCSPTTLYPPRPSGFMEFDVTKAMRSWSKGAPNYGLLLKVVNETANGRGLRFYSKSDSNSGRHPFIYVTCSNKTIHSELEEKRFTKNVIKDDKELGKGEQGFTKNVAKSDIGGTDCSQNSDVTHSKPFLLHIFFNIVFAFLYLIRL